MRGSAHPRGIETNQHSFDYDFPAQPHAARARVVSGTGRPGNRHMPGRNIDWKSNSQGPYARVHLMYARVRIRPILARCLRRQPTARVHGQHPGGPDFVSAAGGRGPGIAEPAPAPPACQGRCARACKTPAHQPPPACASTNNPPACAIARANIGRIRTRARTPNAPARTGLANSISNQYCARACAYSWACQCR